MLDIEKRLYANVMTMMAIFVGIFSLVDVNLFTFANGADGRFMVAINLATVGSLSALIGLMALMLKPHNKASRVIPWIICVISFAASIFVGVLM